MSAREELVTAALLGTDRRARTAAATGPLPTGPVTTDPNSAADQAPADPALELLAEAGRSAVARRAGRRLPAAPPAPRAPEPDRLLAAPEAQAVLDRILDPPQVELVNVWLAAAAAYGVGVAPAQWPGLVRLAVRNTGVDPGDLAAALGSGGRWFVAQNPQWSRLETTLRQPPPRPAAPPGPAPDAQAVREHPDAIFAAPGPWPRPLLDAALSVLASGRLQWGAIAYAQALGARMPLEFFALVRSLAQDVVAQAMAAQDMAAQDVAARPRAGGRGRTIEDAFAALVATAAVRAEIHTAFQAPPTRDPQETR